MIETITPSVSMLNAFERDPELIAAEQLAYPYLMGKRTREDGEIEAPVVHQVREREGAYWRECTDAEGGSVEEAGRARALAIANFILLGEQLQDGTHASRERFSQDFTQASIELYGEPEPRHVAALAAYELNTLQGYLNMPGVDKRKTQGLIAFFEGQLGSSALETEDLARPEIDATILDQFKDMLEERYGSVLEIFDGVSEQKKVSPEEVRELFTRTLAVLGETDPVWLEWSVEIGKKHAMEVTSQTKSVRVGTKVRSGKSLWPLVVHEVLVHGQRAVRGSKSQEHMAEHGLPEYLDAEEGLARFLQRAASGNRDAITNNLYMNIGLALGQLEKEPMTRQELQKVHMDRLIVQKQAASKPVDLYDLDRQSWRHVNRVYRGSLGNEHIGVNTKDIAYHAGIMKIATFIQESLEAGQTPAQIFDYLTVAKFDPTNEQHVKYLEDVGLIKGVA